MGAAGHHDHKQVTSPRTLSLWYQSPGQEMTLTSELGLLGPQSSPGPMAVPRKMVPKQQSLGGRTTERRGGEGWGEVRWGGEKKKKNNTPRTGNNEHQLKEGVRLKTGTDRAVRGSGREEALGIVLR